MRWPGSRAVPSHRTAAFVMPRTGVVLPWAIGDGTTWMARAPTRILTDFVGLVSFARAGGGLVQVYDYLAEEAVRRGELVEVLHTLKGAGRPFNLIHPASAAKRAAVRCVIDFIVEHAGTRRRRVP